MIGNNPSIGHEENHTLCNVIKNNLERFFLPKTLGVFLSSLFLQVEMD